MYRIACQLSIVQLNDHVVSRVGTLAGSYTACSLSLLASESQTIATLEALCPGSL